ncbi:ferredoxin domain-containing protein [Methanopyrus sp.]
MGPESEGVRQVARLMAVAARTAPKTRGIDDIVVEIVEDEDTLEEIAERMEKIAEEKGADFFKRDAECLRKSECLVLIGVKSSGPCGLNCGMCGASCDDIEERSADVEFAGPICGFKLIDLGIALGSAAKIANDLVVDNRLMYTVGVAARSLGVVDADVVIGIPLSATGKNIYFDREG